MQFTIDQILDASNDATSGDWFVRKTVDTSGDYDFPTYDILSLHHYGPEGIGTAHQNPYNAILFSGAKLLAEEVKRLRAEVIGLRGSLYYEEPSNFPEFLSAYRGELYSEYTNSKEVCSFTEYLIARMYSESIPVNEFDKNN